jgi:hypothetical protein
MTRLAVRWTVGDVSDEGFTALQLSIWGAWKAFGPRAEYAVCVNSRPLTEAREATGALPAEIAWLAVDRSAIPEWLAQRLDGGMAEGVGWKFAPLRLFDCRWALALDNDCILWDRPRAVRRWLEADRASVLAEDVRACFGQFADLCSGAPRNAGIRGLPPSLDLEGALHRVLEERPVTLTSELDEQGLQVAALERAGPTLAVGLDEVTICSPLPPNLPGLGSCGAHFIGLNARALPWSYEGRPASELVREHFHGLEPVLRERVGLTA